MGGSVDLLKNMFSIMRITRKPQKYTLVACMLIKRADEIWNTLKEVLCIVSIDKFFSFFIFTFLFIFERFFWIKVRYTSQDLYES